VWAESRRTPDDVAALAARPEHSVWVAEVDGTVAGFAWGFLARTHGHGTAWELDLLAVHPDRRGHGLGRALVQAVYTAGRARGAPRCRAIVAETNLPSQRAFRAAGFTMTPGLRDLLVRHVRGVDAPPALPPAYEPGADYDSYVFRLGEPPARLTTALNQYFAAYDVEETPLVRLEGLPVYTLTYSGLWLEAMLYRGAETLGALVMQAETFAREHQLADLGHLAPPGAWRTRDDFVGQGFHVENSYYEFERSY
jgi:GNAT superfamily N-acetyltransferase